MRFWDLAWLRGWDYNKMYWFLGCCDEDKSILGYTFVVEIEAYDPKKKKTIKKA